MPADEDMVGPQGLHPDVVQVILDAFFRGKRQGIAETVGNALTHQRQYSWTGPGGVSTTSLEEALELADGARVYERDVYSTAWRIRGQERRD